MRQLSTLILLAVSVTHVYSAPQFITFKDGKLGVNFGGYHAGVGLGGLLGGGAGGGLYAEAGTPHGQAARAGLGGVVDGNGRTAGGLYAGATAGGNVMAGAGLAGGVVADNAAGSGYAAAQGGGHSAASGLAGETSGAGSAGFTFSGTKSIGIPTTIVKETDFTVVPVEEVKTVHKKVHTELNVDSENEISPAPLPVPNFEAHAKAEVDANVDLNTRVQPVIIKEVYVQQPQVVEKHIIHTHVKPHHHHAHKTAYIGGYIGGGAEIPPPPPPPSYVEYKSVPAIQKRVDVSVESDAAAAAEAGVNGNGGAQVTYRKEFSVARNPNFFKDIFDIPIAALRSVSNLITNGVANTNFSVQKSASIQAGGYYY